MSGEEPATQIAPVKSPQMVSTVKLPILKKGEYTLWSMRMEQYLTNTDYSLWQVILNEGLDKAYDRFQKLIGLLEVHGSDVFNEDTNQNILRALPSSWNNVALIMRNKDSIDDLDIDDLYNNLKVLEADIKGFLGSASNSPQLDDEDLEQIDHDDLEEMDWKRIFKKRTKNKVQKRQKPSTGWKRQSQIEAKVSQSQKVNPNKVKSQPSEENTT
ncbi:hypothetical protein Tco_0714276 [Tanacetum coccineum]